MYAVTRSVIRALIDSLTAEDLTDLNTPLNEVRLRQLAKVARLERDKGMKGDGFEWAVHEAIMGKEPSVIEPIAHALRRCSKSIKDAIPQSLLFGQERARYLGFIDAMVDTAGVDAYLLPEAQGRPFRFGPWVSIAARGHDAEYLLKERIKKIWKTDLFVNAEGDPRHLAVTVKSTALALEGGQGLRIGIVPEHKDQKAGIHYNNKVGLWQVSLADPDGFMGLFNDAYHAVARAMLTLGKLPQPPYYVKPTPAAQRIQEQLEKYGDARAIEVEEALNEAAQQDLVGIAHQLVGVNAPEWLHIKQMAPKIISPKPKFSPLSV
ncbi:hypothetical protein ASF45_31050 [Pseudorhodoferax sp. Leaf265]|nr:hypothetical protein ASF45_31050 [Pseudorhodoferax sp. Leaf265]